MTWEKLIAAGIRMPFYMELFVGSLKEDITRHVGLKLKNWVSVTDKQLTSIYYDSGDEQAVADFLLKNIPQRAFTARLPKLLKKADVDLLKYCRGLYYRDYQNVDKKTLRSLLKKFTVLFKIKFELYSLPKLLGDSLQNLLPKFTRAIPKDDLQNLITPAISGDFAKERIALLSLAKNIIGAGLKDLFNKSNEEIIEQLGRFYPSLYYQVETYVREYNWVPVNHHVQPLSLDTALSLIRKTLADPTADRELKELLDKPKKILKIQKNLFKKYNFSDLELRVINFLKDLNAINESRKSAMSRALLWSYPMFQAIADKVEIDVVSLRQLNSREILEVLEKGAVGRSRQREINKRLDFYYCLLGGGQVSQSGGEKARQFIKKLLAIENNAVKEFKGVIAHKGKAIGRVRLIRMEYQVQNLTESEILVTSMTDPDMVPAMKKAAAIVTDEGGITCHAAIVARELKKPCIIGTKIATQVLKDGDLVEVDANNGVVRKIK